VLQRLFVYGTLLDGFIQKRLIGHCPASKTATLIGYRRVRMRDEPWPSIRPSRFGNVEGKILFGLSTQQLRKLDLYEGKAYRRKRVRPRFHEGGFCNTWVYLARDSRGKPLQSAE